MLSDYSIHSMVRSGELKIDPYTPLAVQPASVDLTLDSRFKCYQKFGELDPFDQVPDEALIDLDTDTLVLQQGEFVLASTVERIGLPDHIGARIEGKSSLARLGISIHSTGGFIDPGFEGNITLEISNVNPNPVVLHAGMKISQISFDLMDRRVTNPYGSDRLNSKYQGQSGPVESRFFMNERSS